MYPFHKIVTNFSIGNIEKQFSYITTAINNATAGLNTWLTNNNVRLHQYEAYLFKVNGITISPSNIFPADGQTMFSLKDTVINIPSNMTLTAGSSGSLADGTYYVQVSAKNASGETTPCTEQSIAVSASGSGSIGVSWDAVTGANAYVIYMSDTSGNEKFVESTTSTSYTVTNMPSSTITPLSVNTAHDVVDGITIDMSTTGGAKVAYKVGTSGSNDMTIQVSEILEDGSTDVETITIPANSAANTLIELNNKISDITGILIDRTATGEATDKGDFVTVADRVITTH